uniref:Envelope glycoprotein n=1 Tax=Rhinolophus ferrumequinum TaxID=59479 RepID=A0A671E1F1_RHIFE
MEWLLALTLLNIWEKSHAGINPHQPHKLTWTLTDGQTQTTLNSTTHTAPINTWWPDLFFDLRDIFGTKRGRQYDYSVRSKRAVIDTSQGHSAQGFWACPGNLRNNWKTCGGPDRYYCGSWSCVTSYDGPRQWDVGNRDLVKFSFRDPHNRVPQVRVQFNQDVARRERGWLSGLTWGFQLDIGRWAWIGPHPGGLLTIRLSVEMISTQVGPNKVLAPLVPTKNPGISRDKNTAGGTAGTQPKTSVTPLTPATQPTKDSLRKLVRTVYETLNATSPNLTTSCWLCYDIKPPFYEAIGLNATYNASNGKNPSQCSWGNRKIGLTMQLVSGNGTCLGKVPQAKQSLCASIDSSPSWKSDTKWLIPRTDGWWICSKTGLTPCLSTSVFNAANEFCVLVTVLPRILYHPEESMYSHWDSDTSMRSKREPITALTIATLFSLGIDGAGTGIASLATQQSGMTSLRAAIDEDIERLETSISHLEKSLTSLSEVVLQNRRGLDLLFLQQGGLCAALGEECCFYADHTGVVKESMAKVREGLAKRKREREAQENWFEAWFNRSPWLTTLVSTLVGPIILLVLILTLGPCILNKLINFVKDRVNTVQLMVLRQQYETVPTREDLYGWPVHEQDSSL